MRLTELATVLGLLWPLLTGAALALIMMPLHALVARRRRLALLVDRIVTDRIARLTGFERRRAARYLHRQAAQPTPRAVGLALVTGTITVAATAIATDWWSANVATARRTLLRTIALALSETHGPSSALADTFAVVAVLSVLVGGLLAASLHVGALDVERRHHMPVTRPWPIGGGTAVFLLAVVFDLLLLGSDAPGAATLFLLGHQVVARAIRPSACQAAPAVPEALRAARLPQPRERRSLLPRLTGAGRHPEAAAPGAVPAAGWGPPSSAAPPPPPRAAASPAAPSGPAPSGPAPSAPAPSPAAPSPVAPPAPPRAGRAPAAPAPAPGSPPAGVAAPAGPVPSPAPAGPGSDGGHRGPAAPVPRTPVPYTRLIDMAPTELALRPHDPRSVGDYRLTGRLGSGGMGTVYLGQRAGTTGTVAIKVLAPHLLDDVDARTRFLQEGQTLQKVTGDYTARVLGVGFDGSAPFIVMERLDGPSLHAFVADSGAIVDGDMLTRTAIALGRALAALHADGITHRDLKPGNILLTSVGPKVVDFGIAKVVGQTRHTPVGNMVGTPGYMAPEQVNGNGAGPATDVWAWACCVVFAARGDHLFDGENIVDIARQILDGPPGDAFAGVGRLSPRLVPVLRRATAQDPTERPRDGAALLRLLDRSGATATVGPAAWDRLVGAGAR